MNGTLDVTKQVFILMEQCCVYVYTLPPAGFFRLHEVCDIRENFGSTIFC